VDILFFLEIIVLYIVKVNKNNMKKTIYWAVRAFAILFILFVSLFALDVSPFSWLGLFIHLLPSLVLLVILVISWLQGRIGGILWILAAVGLLIMAWGNNNLLTYLIISGPPLVIGILFIWSSSSSINLPKSPAASGPMKMPDQNT